MHENAQPTRHVSSPAPGTLTDKPKSQPIDDISSASATPSVLECVICCDTITDPCQVRPCNHRPFDYLCVATWLFSDPRCPVCRAAVHTLARDSTGELLTDFYTEAPTLNVHPPSVATSSRHSHRPPPTRAHLRRGPRSRCPSQSRRYATVAPEEPSAALRRRQDVYLHSRYSKHVGSNRLSQYRDLTPQLFRADEQLVSRARMWIRRELQVFAFLRPDDDIAGGSDDSSGNPAVRRRQQNAEFLLEYIVAILKSVDLAGSAGEAENMLSEFLGRDNTRLFLHELRAWLRSPYIRLEDWDRAVQYEVEPTSGGPGRSLHAEQATRGEPNHRRFGVPREGRDKRRFVHDRYVPSSPSRSGPSRSGPSRSGPLRSRP